MVVAALTIAQLHESRCPFRLRNAMEEGIWLRKLRSWPRRGRYASEHVRTVSPRMSVIQTKTGSKKPWPPSSARSRGDWSTAKKSLSILSKTAIGNSQTAMKPGRAGTTTNDYKLHGTTTDFAALKRSRRCPLHL